MPLGALGTTLVVGHVLSKEDLVEHFGKDKFKLFAPWYYNDTDFLLLLSFLVKLDTFNSNNEIEDVNAANKNSIKKIK